MTRWSILIACAVNLTVIAQNTPATPQRPSESGIVTDPRGREGIGEVAAVAVSVRERTAHSSARIESPKSLIEIMACIERSFGVKISVEPLPEQCAGAVEHGVSFEPFAINVGERFGEVIERLKETSQGRWLFEEIHGVPLMRPDSSLPGHGTLLDTVVTVNINATSMWDALCALARAINHKNGVHTSGARPLIITFFAPSLLNHPLAMFIEKKAIAISLDHASAREVLCAIIAQMTEKNIWITYSYNCVVEGGRPDYDYISVDAFNSDGKVINGGRMRGEEIERLIKTVDWMSDEDILAVQAPVSDDAIDPKK